ncbi:MAG: hypothetical protein U0931_40240 [Vulcanimicrobiota bacterium]
MLAAIALRRLKLITSLPSGCDPQKKLIYLAQLASLGYSLDNPGDYNDSVLAQFEQTVDLLKAMRGGQVEYVPLFSGFPTQVPEERGYFVERMIGFLVNECLDYPAGTRLQSGVVVPDWLFDLKQFGADPITQMQDPRLFEAARKAQSQRKQDTHVEWVRLRFAPFKEVEERLLAYLQANLYARSSIQEVLRPDLEYLLGHFSPDLIDPARVVFRETRTYLTKYYWQLQKYQAVTALADTPTDYLRLFASLTGSDTSLAEKTRFPRLNGQQRRVVMRGLEGAANLEEDLRRYRGLWLAIGRGLHPGALAGRFPRTATAFSQLRNETIRTFNSPIEVAFREGHSLEVLEKLAQRPALLARRLQQLLKANPGCEKVIFEEFRKVAGQVPLKLLIQLESYFRNQWRSPYRSILNKKGKMLIMQRPYSLNGQTLEQAADILRAEARAQVASRPGWAGQRAWIDPRLKNYTLPLALRKTSEGMLVYGRGTRIPLEAGKVLRLFVYWKQNRMRTDLDLSLIQFDAEMQYSGHVSYTRLASEGIVHSGDLQDAPLGAAEFIDAELSALRKIESCRYLAPQINRYCGEYFGLMECHAGWMIRDKVEADYDSFDLKTVQNKFDLTGTAGFALPMLVDLEKQEIIITDLYMPGLHLFNRVEGTIRDISLACAAMVSQGEMLPNYYDLAELHQQCRGAQRVDDPDQADLTFGLSGTTYAVDRFEKVLAELL